METRQEWRVDRKRERKDMREGKLKEKGEGDKSRGGRPRLVTSAPARLEKEQRKKERWLSQVKKVCKGMYV